MTLIEFLLARIGEDEAAAFEARTYVRGHWRMNDEMVTAGERHVAQVRELTTVEHIARHDPARVLAECEAKRRIVERAGAESLCDEHRRVRDSGCGECIAAEAVDIADVLVLLDLAAVYADHPDYRDEWRP